MQEFRFWRWTLRPEQPTIMHVVKDEISPGVIVVLPDNQSAGPPDPAQPVAQRTGSPAPDAK